MPNASHDGNVTSRSSGRGRFASMFSSGPTAEQLFLEELQQREATATVALQQAHFVGPAVVTTFSPKGGVGKTTTSACESITWANGRRSDRCVVIGADSNAGTLSVKMGQRLGWTLQKLADETDKITSYEKLVQAFGFQGEGVMVVASDPDPERDPRSVADIGAVIQHLSQYLNVFKIDLGIDYNSPLTQAVLGLTDLLVLQTDPTKDALIPLDSLVTKLKDDPNYAHLLSEGILLINKVKADTPYLEQIKNRYYPYFARINMINFDSELDKGGEVDLSSLQYETRVQYREHSATIAQRLAVIRPPKPEDQLDVPVVESGLDWLDETLEDGASTHISASSHMRKESLATAQGLSDEAPLVPRPRIVPRVTVSRVLGAGAAAVAATALTVAPMPAAMADDGPGTSQAASDEGNSASGSVDAPPSSMPDSAPVQRSTSHGGGSSLSSSGDDAGDQASGSVEAPPTQPTATQAPASAPPTDKVAPSRTRSTAGDAGKRTSANAQAKKSSKAPGARVRGTKKAAARHTVTHKAPAARVRAAKAKAPAVAPHKAKASKRATQPKATVIRHLSVSRHQTASHEPIVGQVYVTNGDTLWQISEDALSHHLGRVPFKSEVESYWHQIYGVSSNHHVIGGNPDLIHPGQHLLLPRYVPAG